MVCVCVHTCTYESWHGALKMGTSLFPDWPTEIRKKIELFMWPVFQPLTFLPHPLSIIQTRRCAFLPVGLFLSPLLTFLSREVPPAASFVGARLVCVGSLRTGLGRVGVLPPASFSLKWCLGFGSRISSKFKGS